MVSSQSKPMVTTINRYRTTCGNTSSMYKCTHNPVSTCVIIKIYGQVYTYYKFTVVVFTFPKKSLINVLKHTKQTTTDKDLLFTEISPSEKKARPV